MRRTRGLSVADGMLHAVMLGVAESYLGAMAVELGHRDVALALLTTIPLVVGALAQLAAGPLTRWLGGRRRMIVAGASLQAVSQLGLVAIALGHETGIWPLLVVKTLFWTSGAVIAPVWNAWMMSLTDARGRERWFAWRSAAVHLALVGAYLGAGFFLDHARHVGALFRGFAILYGVGIAARLVSAVLLRLHADPPPEAPSEDTPAGSGARLRRALTSGEWRVALLVAGVMFGTYVAVPFFTPYMLRELGLDFDTYALLTSVAILTKSLVFPFYGPLAERLGLRRVMLGAGALVTCLPLAWALVPTVPGLVVVEVFSGVAWAGFEFATFQLLLQGSPASCRVEFFSLASSVAGVAQLAGALVGSAALAGLALSYQEVFIASAALRGAAVLLIATPLGRGLARWPIRKVLLWLSNVRVVAGVERRPVVTNAPPEDAVAGPPDALDS